MAFFKTCNIEFDEINITITDQNSTSLETENKVNFTLFINKWKWCNILQNEEQESMVKDTDFYYLRENIEKNLWIQD